MRVCSRSSWPPPSPAPRWPAHRVDLVDEDDAGGILLALFEEVAHAGSAHAHEHLHEIRAADAEERHVGLTRDGPRQQGLARSRRADEEHALGYPAPEFRESLRIAQEFDDLFELSLGLLDACHVLEGHPVLPSRGHPGLALAEGEGLSSAGLHLPHEEDPDTDEEQHGKPGDEDGLPYARLVVGLRLDPDPVLCHELHELGIVGCKGLELPAVFVRAADILSLDGYRGHLVGIDRLDEIAERHILVLLGPPVIDVEKKKHKKDNKKPDKDTLVERVESPVFHD